MRQQRTVYEVWCLLCSTEVGQFVDGKFRRHAGCTAAMLWKAGLPRCCHCGGSLYVEKSVPAAVSRPAVACAYASGSPPVGGDPAPADREVQRGMGRRWSSTRR